MLWSNALAEIIHVITVLMVSLKLNCETRGEDWTKLAHGVAKKTSF